MKTVAGGASTTRKLITYVFFPGAKPFGPGSHRCRKITISDQLEFVTPSTMICGQSPQDLMVVLNEGCANIVDGGNNSECSSIFCAPLLNLIWTITMS